MYSRGLLTLLFAALAGCTGPEPSSTEPTPLESRDDVVFHSDWSTATGSSNAAIRDTGKSKPWTILAGGAQPGVGGFTVYSTASEGRDYPTTNFARVVARQADIGWTEIAFQASDGYVAPPAVGESLYIRYYARMLISDSFFGDDLTHGSYFGRGNTGCCPAIPWEFQELTNANGQWVLRVQVRESPQTSPFTTGSNSQPFASSLNKNQTYRIEARHHRTGENTYNLYIRIYDIGGTRVLDSSDFNGWNSGMPTTTLGTGYSVTWAGHERGLSHWRMGVNGLAGIDADYDFIELAGVAICTDDWCGPYSGGM